MVDLIPATIGSLHVNHLERTLGVFFVGYMFAAVIYGFIFFSAYIYHSRYPKDPWTNRIMVSSIWGIETAAICFLSKTLHHHLVDLFPFTIGIEEITWPFCVQILLSTVAIFISQLYYATKVLSEKGWTAKATAYIIMTFATTALALGIVVSTEMFQDKILSDMAVRHRKIVAAFHFGTNLLSGLGSFYATASTQRYGASDRWDNAVSLAIRCGGLALVVQAALFAVFLASPQNLYWIPFYLVAARLFTIAPIIILNSRPSADQLQWVDKSDFASIGPSSHSHDITLDSQPNRCSPQKSLLSIKVSQTTRQDSDSDRVFRNVKEDTAL
ncbi:hypothetical protein HYPSUDRAFT_42711 [Hypholoma sublateritium FD-334 SS-4]|uniref:Uncharacterized protein n=1 Tax=Hypholoma sublateritium (strain FD-334 SS-4) TaxID=945553 RepID=A0A0D2NWL7_HYPSF|nr:hypothetical protein HYPSUDRAFT_42711 [Hypholoma sublateritium FD-334 SS-4]